VLSSAPWHATGKEKSGMGAETKLFGKPLKNGRIESFVQRTSYPRP